MLPSLSPLSDSGPAGARVSVPPPLHFKPILGTPYGIRVRSTPYERQKGDTPARENGLRYEAKIQTLLESTFHPYWPSPKVSFYDKSGLRFIVPDGLILRADRTVIFEIKFAHCPEAWWQLRKLYSPILELAYSKPVQVVEIVRSYDPATPFPETPELLTHLDSWTLDPAKLNTFGVLVCKS